ncbi:hypothetical protein GGR72_003232 [Xanthomonas arboricola]|nr:hypothetical protein [Xanthomonas arboricola]
MSRRIFRTAVVSAIVLAAAGGYFVYSLIAAQGQGALAQSPLNNATSIPPAFIMAVDDSNSMTFERIFRGGDGRLRWSGSSFFSSAGVFFEVGESCTYQTTNRFGQEITLAYNDCYSYLFPFPDYNSSYSPGVAIPPIDQFGFARSPVYNAGYYDPSLTYDPWSLAVGNATNKGLWPAADFDGARADSRDPQVYGGGDSDIKMSKYGTVVSLGARRESADDGPFRFMAGMTIPAQTRYRTSSNTRVCNTNNNNGLAGTNGFWISLNSSASVAADCSVQISYIPATFYLPAAAPAPPGYLISDVNRPVIANACGPGCNLRRYQILQSNYDPTTTAYDDAKKNFANWFQYHRNRILSIIGSESRALAAVDKMRVGYFTINNLSPVTMYNIDDDVSRASLFE